MFCVNILVMFFFSLGFTFMISQAATIAFSTPPPTTHAHRTHHHHSHGTHPTREPSEHENFRFVYEPTTHHMVMANGQNCYIILLSDAESTAVHTDSGIRALELKLLGLISSGTLVTISKDTLDKKTLHACGHIKSEYFNLS